MFMTGVLSAAGINRIDPDQERAPPPFATPPSFPHPQAHACCTWSPASPPPKLQPLFSKILKPSDISDSHVESLNIQIASPCSPEGLIPRSPNGSSYFPQLAPAQVTNAGSYADAARVDATSARRRKEFDERRSELQITNDTGYRVITRTTKPGARPPRLGYFRKFWEGLETMSPYWDTTMDHYYEAPVSPPLVSEEKERDSKRSRLDSPRPDLTVRTLSSPTEEESSEHEHSITSVQPDAVQVAASETPLPEDSLVDENEDRHDEPRAPSEPSASPRYKGRRTGCGRDMPDQFRTDTVKAFVEGVIWAFQCSIAAPRQLPVVQMGTLNLPVRQTAAVYRLPKERVRARAGFLEGPIFCIQVRPEIDFNATSMSVQRRKGKARLDTIREIGCLLQCAQERCRQGKTEVRPGEGKWWTESPRWGGARDDKVEHEHVNSDTPVHDVLQMAEDMMGAARERLFRPRKLQKTAAMLWKELKCGSKTWDPKTNYEAIGKSPDSNYDQVFMVSSLNHHISILKLTIHTAYTDYIRTAEMPTRVPDEADWSSPRLQRTQWYDLFDATQRVEAFRALWGVMAYLMREMPVPAAASAETDEP